MGFRSCASVKKCVPSHKFQACPPSQEWLAASKQVMD